MTGVDSAPGITPRAIEHLFQLIEDGKKNNKVTMSAYFLELYNDTLIDLLFLLDHTSKVC